MLRLFISYRRSDSQRESFKLYQQLCHAFGEGQTFIDKETLPLGENFPARLRQRIIWADVILIVIGPDWFTVKDRHGRLRLENRFDYVRLEVELALLRNYHQGVPVVPVSVGGVSFSAINLPEELKSLLNLSGHELRPHAFDEDVEELIRKLRKLPVRERSESTEIQPLRTIEQGVNPTQRMVRFGDLLRPLPEDTTLYLRPIENGWQVSIDCPSNPSENRHRGAINTGEMNHLNAQEAVGVLMEWYDVSPHQCKVWRPERKRSSWTDVFSFRKKHAGDEGSWFHVGASAVFTNLHRLLIEFDKDVDRYGTGICNVFQAPHTPIRHGFSTYGYFPDRDNRFFGEYICSITRALGGVNRSTHELLYCPTVPGTRLQYVDLRQPPELVEVDYIGHVGRDESGYHIVFVS